VASLTSPAPRRAEKAKFAYKNGYKLGAPAGCAAMAANMAAVDVGDPILACAAGPSLHHHTHTVPLARVD
jgi:hypothetical protein